MRDSAAMSLPLIYTKTISLCDLSQQSSRIFSPVFELVQSPYWEATWTIKNLESEARIFRKLMHAHSFLAARVTTLLQSVVRHRISYPLAREQHGSPKFLAFLSMRATPLDPDGPSDISLCRCLCVGFQGSYPVAVRFNILTRLIWFHE